MLTVTLGHMYKQDHDLLIQARTGCKAGVKRRTSHEPNRMLMRGNKAFFSFALDSAHVRRFTLALVLQPKVQTSSSIGSTYVIDVTRVAPMTELIRQRSKFLFRYAFLLFLVDPLHSMETVNYSCQTQWDFVEIRED